jgi:hypothetical protein
MCLPEQSSIAAAILVHPFIRTSEWRKTTFNPEIVSFLERINFDQRSSSSSAFLNQHFSERFAIILPADEPYILLFGFELQLFLNAFLSNRLNWLRIQLSTFFLFHSFKAAFYGLSDNIKLQQLAP